jgi:monoterpene epsilon-lactone hydrolase
MLLLAREENLPMLAGHYLCTPAADLSGDGDSLVANAGRDIMPASFLIEMVKQNYANPSVNWKDTLYSPMYAEYDASFPPAIITVGTRDLLLSTGVRLYWKLREAGVRVELLVSEGMWHGFNWEADMPEAVQVRKVVRDFLHQC